VFLINVEIALLSSLCQTFPFPVDRFKVDVESLSDLVINDSSSVRLECVEQKFMRVLHLEVNDIILVFSGVNLVID